MSDRFYRQTDEAWSAEQKRDWLTADGHACVGDDCPGCAAALAPRPSPSASETHPFEPSYTGMVCERMVLRDDYGTPCGLGPAHPVHSVGDVGRDLGEVTV